MFQTVIAIYQEIDLYDEIAAWNILLGSSKMLYT